jgi:N utilization substance protein A
MKNEFTLAFNEVLEEKQLPKEIILKALESAMVSAYRRSVNASSAQIVEANIDPETGKVVIFAEKEVVDSVQDDRTEIILESAKSYDPNAELGSMVMAESTPKDFGRVAAQTARQVIQQRIRDAEHQAQLTHYEKQVGEIISGIVQAVNTAGLTIGLEMRAEGGMARKDMIPGERFRIHDRVRTLVAEVKESPRGPQIILSRTHRDFLRRLLENEVPEIYHGIVEIRSIAREPGERAKVAVSATQAGIDPVGACVGIRGVRIQAIVRELHDEKIDVIEWNSDPALFIAKALSPARVTGVYLNERSANGKTATVIVLEDQLSLAIGRDGQNARLAAKLSGWRIDIKSLTEAANDVLQRLGSDPSLGEIAEVEKSRIADVEVILAKKAENRPLTPEEYDLVAKFVDRVERRTSIHVPAEKVQEEDSRVIEIKKLLPEEQYNKNILDSGLPDHVAFIVQEAGYGTAGELYTKMKLNPDDILRLQGIGPKAMLEINHLVETLDAFKIPTEEPAVEVVEPIVVETVQPVETEVITPEVEPAPVLPEEPVAVEDVALVDQPVVPIVGEPEEETSFDKLFTLPSAMIEQAPYEEEEEEGEGAAGKKGKKKKKRKNVEVVYDPDLDAIVARKKHRRGDVEWEES